MSNRVVKFAKLHGPAFLPGPKNLIQLEDRLEDKPSLKCKGIKMSWSEDGLECELNAIKFLIPKAMVQIVVFA